MTNPITVPEHYDKVVEASLPRAVLVRMANDKMREAAGLLPWSDPVGCVQWIKLDRIQANDYNPNAVAHHEMKLLHTSISEDGYTQPIVAIWDPEAGPDRLGRYVIVDGFHRYTVARRFPEISEARDGYLPVVVIDKPPADRMASTVRHNRARGKHSMVGMGSLVFGMLAEGQTDEEVCNKLGLEAEELARLKHITGYSKLYADHTYGPVVMSKTQAVEKGKYARAHPEEKVPQF
jgi:hypothetical protein